MHKPTTSKKILLIEREEILRKSLSELLTFQGYDLLEARNGYIGLHYAKVYLPDLVICARMFSDMDGWEVLDADL